MCMKEAYMFLTVIVPGLKKAKQKIDVYLQPLIKEFYFVMGDRFASIWHLKKAKLTTKGNFDVYNHWLSSIFYVIRMDCQVS